jgi:hypothetical protein
LLTVLMAIAMRLYYTPCIARWRRFMASIKATKRRHRASTRSDIPNRICQCGLMHLEKGLLLTKDKTVRIETQTLLFGGTFFSTGQTVRDNLHEKKMHIGPNDNRGVTCQTDRNHMIRVIFNLRPT